MFANTKFVQKKCLETLKNHGIGIFETKIMFLNTKFRKKRCLETLF